MGKFIVLPGVNPGTDMPRVDLADPVLPEAGGALMLIEPGHPALGWTDQPIHGGIVPNLAWDQAAALIGSGDKNTLGLVISTAIVSPEYGKFERTTKGGIHGIVSQAPGMISASFQTRLKAPTPILTYLAANPTHDLYVSMATRNTRQGKGNPATSAILRRMMFSHTTIANYGNTYRTQFYAQASATANELLGTTTTGSFPGGTSGAAQLIGRSSMTIPDTPGPLRWSNASNDWVGTAPAAGSTQVTIAWGPNGMGSTVGDGQSTGPLYDIYPSWILYWFYMEDLTVSGRTYAEVEALDLAKYNRHILGLGGRYYGDTFTNPSTLP